MDENDIKDLRVLSPMKWVERLVWRAHPDAVNFACGCIACARADRHAAVSALDAMPVDGALQREAILLTLAAAAIKEVCSMRGGQIHG